MPPKMVSQLESFTFKKSQEINILVSVIGITTHPQVSTSTSAIPDALCFARGYKRVEGAGDPAQVRYL
jgi:hypothetical protein